MNRNILKNLACEGRKELIEKIHIRALKCGICGDKKGPSTDLSNGEEIQKRKIIRDIAALDNEGKNGYRNIIEETSCAWFNRFTALRFMEVNDYLPANIDTISGIEGSFKRAIIARCNGLSSSLPFVFEKSGDSSELLFPEGILKGGNFIKKLTDNVLIPKDDWENVSIIGWLYEYYISEEKNKLMKTKKQYDKEEIPYVTQLFTPDWIVKYMVENSLGRYWVEAHPEQCDLKKNWEFYIEGSQPDADDEVKVEDIRCIDPACGSGHILIYMFDVLYQIYRRCGYRQEEIPELIMENNLYGMDVDDKAHGLSCFAVVMQGMKYNKKLLGNMDRKFYSNIVSIQESNAFDEDDIICISGEKHGEDYMRTKTFIEAFKDAKMYGSLIRLNGFEKSFFVKRLKHIANNPEGKLFLNKRRKKIVEILPRLIKQAEIMSGTYDVLVTNPPYMGNRYFNPLLGNYIARNYPEAKTDMFSAFMLHGFSKVKPAGHLGFMVPFVWMFIRSYEKLRKIVLKRKNISTLIQLEYSGFKEATVPVCTFTLRNRNVDIPGDYIKLSDFKGEGSQLEKTLEAIANPRVNYSFTVNQKKMEGIPGNRFGYWLTDREIGILNKAKVIGDVAHPCTGMQTGNNKAYVRQWFEVDYNLISFSGNSKAYKYWMPYQMGGEARKWYGNISEIIYWKSNGKMVREEKGSIVRNEKFFFKRGISWKRITSGKNTIRVLNKGFIFDQSADSIFVKNEADYKYMLGFFNSKIMENIFKFIAPTLNLTAGTVRQIPIYIEEDPSIRKRIDRLCDECVRISKDDWDSFETSWNFKKHPFLSYRENSNSIEEAYINWLNFSETRFYRLKDIEEELNRIFIKIYGLQNEVSAEVEERDITLRKADVGRDVKSFISYAVGCMFGRYSPDRDGIIYAGGKFANSLKNASFKPEKDNIIPVLDGNYFENDIVSKFVKFVKTIFGKENLSQNLDFIACSLKKKREETDSDTIRRYFFNDFFKDHVKMYRGKPIYWLFTSGKQKAFNCLIYVHRYEENLLSMIRENYLYDIYKKLCQKKKFLYGNFKKGGNKELLILNRKIDELKEYSKTLQYVESMHLKIHLDEGIEANYDKFKILLK
ncbi:MAG TPA: BREX-1 system adenine-specific DNA-methyltransferase PglX [Clostridium sp.]|jgi:phage anti-repressor protein|nr:BREX-1 system adenine-specific DNA-methyltransferase PglX [Clostridium sp.]